MKGFLAFVALCGLVATLSVVPPELARRVAGAIALLAIALLVIAYLCALEGRRR